MTQGDEVWLVNIVKFACSATPGQKAYFSIDGHSEVAVYCNEIFCKQCINQIFHYIIVDVYPWQFFGGLLQVKLIYNFPINM